MLLDHFYTSLSSETLDGLTWTVLIKLNPQHKLYEGHFPGHPVVPGVCLLQLIKESAESIRQHKLQYAQIASCKFLSAIHPSATPSLTVTLTLKEIEEGKLQLQAEGMAEQTCFIKLKAVLIQK